jgi:hypothetical protein
MLATPLLDQLKPDAIIIAGRDRGHGNSHDGFSLGMLARNWAVRLR